MLVPSRPRTDGLLVAALLTAALAASSAQTIVIVALPAFARDLAVPPADATWALTAFMLAGTVATPIAGRLGDLFGYRRVLVACLGCFTAGTLMCALATEAGFFGGLIAGRALQGVAGGVFPLAFGIARAGLAPARLPGVIALLSAMLGIGGAAGMVAAGPITDTLGTPWLFWGTLVLAGIALAAAPVLPADRPGQGGRVDLAGAFLLSGGLICLLLAISQARSWGWGPAAALFGASALLLAAFTAAELRADEPLVDLRLLRHRGPAAANLATFVLAVAMFGAITLVPRLVQTPAAAHGLGASPSQAGLTMLPVALVMVIAGPAAARLGRSRGALLPLRTGIVCAAVSLAVLAAAHGRIADFYLTGLLLGAGYGLAFAAIGIVIVQAAPVHQTGVATAINTIVRTVGGAVGAQTAAAILAARTPAGKALPTESGYTMGFAAFAALAFAALAVTAATRETHNPQHR
ncbi:MFS transporter [Actinomadura vinacea]|uniref:MFS transporter n=1 Tax=Actinomadura vinacea TaxID=115336 RepID=A0ABP5WPQ7_9ACTN